MPFHIFLASFETFFLPSICGCQASAGMDKGIYNAIQLLNKR